MIARFSARGGCRRCRSGGGNPTPDRRYNLAMFERFTDRARKVMALANQEAQRFNHEYINTEHILLGLVKERASIGAAVLRGFGLDLAKVRLEVEKIVESGPDI